MALPARGAGPRIRAGRSRAALQKGALDRALSQAFAAPAAEAALRLRAAALLGGWQAKLTGLLGRARVKAAKPAILRFTKPPVQGELSLDKIKVVRNDLSDADLEVVPARTAGGPASSAPALQTEERAGVVESTWGRATTRLFGAGKTLI